MQTFARPRAALVVGALVLVGSGLLLSIDPGNAAENTRVGRRDWPMLGGTIHRNMANELEKGLPTTWSVKKGNQKNVKWSVRLGSESYGGPVIAGGRIFVGTNNKNPRDPSIKGDRGVLMCFEEATGKLLWQALHEYIPSSDEDTQERPQWGVVSTPCVDGDRLYYVSSRNEVICADVAGDPTTHKAKILWTYDMIKELGVYVCYDAASCSPLVVGDLVFVITGNGTDIKTKPPKLPAPQAPSFIAINKHTGKLVWKDSSPGKRIMEGQWSNPVAAEVNGKMLVIFPGGDGWLYAFEAKSGELVWKFDCNPKKSVFKPNAAGDRSYIVATPVVWENKLYIGVGVNPDECTGVGHLWCIDITKTPKNKDKDVSPVNDNFDPKAEVNKDSALVWHHGGEVMPPPTDGGRELVFERTASTVAIHDGLVYAAEKPGFLQCLDARTGKKYWEYDMKAATWASPYYVDGRVFIGTDDGSVVIFRPGKKLEEPTTIEMDHPLKLSPVAANGVLYVNTGPDLFAIATP